MDEIRDWAAGLPVHIMDQILDRLVDLSDYIRFTSVCVTWSSLALDDRNRHHHNKVRIISTTQIPMLMVGGPGSGVFSVKWDGDENGKAQFYSVTRGKVLDNFHLPSPYNTYRHIIGSAFGWLINVDQEPSVVGVTLFNPFSCSVIRLPPISLPGISFNHFDYFKHTVKATLSKDPALYPDDYIVLIIYGQNCDIACIKPGDGGLWRGFAIPDRGYIFSDVIYSNSKGLFLGVSGNGQVSSIDITGNIGEGRVFDRFTPPHQPRRIGVNLRYIVETPTGDLLQVCRFIAPPRQGGAFKTLGFMVSKLSNSEEKTWCELKSLGDMALFVGDGSSVCVSASGFSGCQPGSVYFSLPSRKYYKITHIRYANAVLTGKTCDKDWLHYDMGVADVGAELIKRFKLKTRPCKWLSMVDKNVHVRPIWMVPTFKDQRPRDKEEDIVLKRPRDEEEEADEDITPTIPKQPRKEEEDS